MRVNFPVASELRRQQAQQIPAIINRSQSPHCNAYLIPLFYFNSSPPSDAYMHQWTGSAIVQVMACCLFGDKPSPEPMLVHCQLDSWQQISVKFKSEFYHFHWRKCIWNCHLPIWRPFCPGGDEITHLCITDGYSFGFNFTQWACFLKYQVWGKMAAVLETTLSNTFSGMKIFDFQIKFHWTMFHGYNWQLASIGTDNNLAPNRDS